MSTFLEKIKERAKSDKKTTIIEGLEFKNNKEYDIKV